MVFRTPSPQRSQRDARGRRLSRRLSDEKSTPAKTGKVLPVVEGAAGDEPKRPWGNSLHAALSPPRPWNSSPATSPAAALFGEPTIVHSKSVEPGPELEDFPSGSPGGSSGAGAAGSNCLQNLACAGPWETRRALSPTSEASSDAMSCLPESPRPAAAEWLRTPSVPLVAPWLAGTSSPPPTWATAAGFGPCPQTPPDRIIRVARTPGAPRPQHLEPWEKEAMTHGGSSEWAAGDTSSGSDMEDDAL